ncbi:MAG: type II/IV secretion system protein [Candidatus Pacebacteria bacterium]|nr:type II/IV secretion system protein [Candidatus Paceibacterota bacterium]
MFQNDGHGNGQQVQGGSSVPTMWGPAVPAASSRFERGMPVPSQSDVTAQMVSHAAVGEVLHGGHRDAELFIQGVLNEAISRRASDVHFEPRTDQYRVRLRIDGVLHVYLERPLEEYASVLNTVKVLADVDIAEHSLPQDGHIEIAVAGRDMSSTNEQHVYDVRVSTFPSVNGEVVVMRVLNRSDALLSVDALGMDQSSFKMLRTMLLSSFGMILVTGPTGSGKTTTLYSMMRELKSTEKNMITLEDPIEFHLDWMRQCEIREERGFTYERAMSAVLRQDPDVLMVGEVRDAKTAEYAVRSALVGHLVGCTIHANTTTGTIARLLDLGVPRSSLAHALNGVIAQRLVRMVCASCKEPYTPEQFHLEHFGLRPDSGTYYRGRGCAVCNNTGYAGRVAIYSVMLVTDGLRSMIFGQHSLVDIQQFAMQEGMRTLKMDAVAKVLAGITTVEEAARVI